MHSSPGRSGEGYHRSSRHDPLHSPIASSPPRTSRSYEQPFVNGEVLLEEITTRPASSLDRSRRNTSATNTSSKLESPPRRWRLVPASCTCPVHGTSQDYGVGSSSFMSDDSHREYSRNDTSRQSRYSSTRGKLLDEELDKLKGSVYQLESDVLKMPRRISPERSFRTSTMREKTQIESTRKELESELHGYQLKLLDQMEGLKSRLEHESSQRAAKEHDLVYKTNQCERLQRQLDDALQKLHLAEDHITELTASKNKAKDRLREVMEEQEYALNRSMEKNSKVADEMRRILENEMEVRVQVENELQHLQKLVERGMGDSMESRKALDTKMRELEDVQATNSRLERELYALRGSADQNKASFNSEIDQKENDCRQLREQLTMVTTQLERERDAHAEQMQEKIQELNNLQRELQRLQKRVAELEALLEKSNSKHKLTGGEAEQQRSKIIELEAIKSRLESEVTQLHNRMRNVDHDRERMVNAIHDLQSQLDALQSKTVVNSNSSENENTRLVLAIRELEAQVEDLKKRMEREREQTTKLVSEVDETNSALDEVRASLEQEIQVRTTTEQENELLQKMFDDELKQWRAKEAEWERERSEARERGMDAYEQDQFARLQADIERLEIEEQERNKEIEIRDAEIESLRDRLAEVEAMDGGHNKSSDERLRMEAEGFQEQLKELCIQIEESAQKLEKESKARADAEAGKKRLEKALLELNAKLQATPTKSRDAEVASLKDKLAQVEDELERSRISGREVLDDFEFDPDMLDVDDNDIDETGDHVRVRLSDIQRVLRKLNQLVENHHATKEIEVTENGEEEQQEEEEEEEEEVVEDEEEEEEEPQEAPMANGHTDFEDLEPFEVPTTPNGTPKRVHFGTPSPSQSPPSTPPQKDTTPPHTPPSQNPAAPLTPKTPTFISPTTPTRKSLLPTNEAERDRLNSEWKRHVDSKANKYTHSRIPLSSPKRLYPESPKTVEREQVKTKIETLRKSASDGKIPETPQTPTTPGPAPGFYYIPVKSDEIDETLSKVVTSVDSAHLSDIPKNFSRLDKGVYQFGTKKIHMQIRDGDLVVRVGGGYMLFVEYLAKHAKVENVKFQRTEERKHLETPKKAELTRELPKHNDTIQMGTLVRRGHKLMLVTNT